MIVIEILIILMYIALYVCSMHRFILELNLIHFPIFWYHQTTTLTERIRKQESLLPANNIGIT